MSRPAPLAARRRVLRRLAALPLLAAGTPAPAQPVRTLKMGLIPFLSTRALVTVFDPLRSVPSPGFAVHPRLAPTEREQLRAALLAFAGTSDGAGSISRSAFEPLTIADLDSLAPYAERLRRALAGR